MTTEELKYKLLNDPVFLINFILDNNPGEVAERMMQVGYSVSTDKDEQLQVVNELWESGKSDDLIYVLSVPYVPEKVSSLYDQAIEEAAETVLSRSVTTRSSDGTSSGFGVNQILGILAGALTGYISTSGGVASGINSTNQIPNYNTGSYFNQSPQKDNTVWWIVGSILFVALVILVIFLIRKYRS